MDTEEALRWLAQHQPLPNDALITEEKLEIYDQIRLHFLRFPDERCVPLFLNSFGGRSGFGIYQLIDDNLCLYSPGQVLPHLLNSLSSPDPYVRQWSAGIASCFPDTSLIGPLARLLVDSDEDVKSMAIIALRQIPDKLATSILSLYAENEPNTSLRELAVGD